MGKVNCLRCRFRHEDNGNCTAVGGFCTAVTAAHCPLLREYLDTGLTPEEVLPKDKADEIALKLMRLADLESLCSYARLRELAEADKDERVVVLPVKPVLSPSISSTLYIIKDGDIYEDALYEAVVGMSESGKTNVVYTTLSDQMIFEQADIGKTVFLTRKGAEKALEAMRKEVAP